MATVSWYPPFPIVDEVDAVIAKWRDYSCGVNPDLSDDIWDTAACRALVASIIAGDDPTPALRRYATHREYGCFLQDEVITDLTCLVAVEPRAEIIDTLAAGATIADTFHAAGVSPALDGLAGLPGLSYMLERLDEEYRLLGSLGRLPSSALELHCYRPPAGRAIGSLHGTLVTAEYVRERYPTSPVGCLGSRLFVAVVSRDGRGPHVGSGEIPEGVHVWREALPDEPAHMRALLTDLVET